MCFLSYVLLSLSLARLTLALYVSIACLESMSKHGFSKLLSNYAFNKVESQNATLTECFSSTWCTKLSFNFSCCIHDVWTSSLFTLTTSEKTLHWCGWLWQHWIWRGRRKSHGYMGAPAACLTEWEQRQRSRSCHGECDCYLTFCVVDVCDPVVNF